MSLREKLLATPKAAAAPPKPVPCDDFPDLAGQVFVRKASPGEIDRYFAKEHECERTAACVFWLCDENGRRVLKDHEAAALAELDLLPLVERINSFGREYNGLTDENRKGLVKNSKGGDGTGDGSPASSPEA